MLPIKVSLRHGIPISGVIENVSSTVGIPVTVLLRWLDITKKLDHSNQLDHSDWLTREEITTLSRAMRIPEAEIMNARMSQVDAKIAPAKRRWVSITSARRTRQEITTTLRISESTRVCPLCISERRPVRLLWRTGWMFACTRHQVLLVDTCPTCCLPLGAYRRPARVLIPNCCNNHPPKGLHCQQSLSEIPTISIERFPKLLQAQGKLEAAMSGRETSLAGKNRTPLDFLRSLREIIEFLEIAAPVETLCALPQQVLERVNRHAQIRMLENNDLRGDSSVLELETTQAFSVRETKLFAATIPLALEIARLESLQAIEDCFMNLVQWHCLTAPKNSRPLMAWATNRTHRKRRSPLFVVFRELSNRIKHHYGLYDDRKAFQGGSCA